MSIPAYTNHEQLKRIMPIRGDDELNKKGGYTTIPHWMIDDLPGLTGNHRAFLQKIARETWGRQLRENHISLKEFEIYLCLSKNTVLEIRDFLVANHYIEMRTTNGGRCTKTTYSILVNGSASEPLIPNKRVRNGSTIEQLNEENGSTIEQFTKKKPAKTVQPLNSMGSTIEQLNPKNCSTIEHPIIKKEEKNFLKKDYSTENSNARKDDSQLAAQAAPLEGELVAVKPKKAKPEKTEHQMTCAQVWEAYRTAYLNRYNVEPIRNAKVNAQVSKLVTNIGANAVQMAAWFLGHNNAYYIRNYHSIGLLLANCESLHTQWQTGAQMTAKTAQQTDNTQSNLNAMNDALALVKQKYGKEGAQ